MLNKQFNIFASIYMFLTLLGLLCFFPKFEISILICSNSMVLAFLHAVGYDNRFVGFILLTWIFAYLIALIVIYILCIKKNKYKHFVFIVGANAIAMLIFTILKVLAENYIGLKNCIIGMVFDFIVLALFVHCFKHFKKNESQ